MSNTIDGLTATIGRNITDENNQRLIKARKCNKILR